MVLPSGTKLGPYEVVELIGAGGMGEVYRARDTRLGRDVAIKVLPASFAADPERLRRFEQEARAVAALSHPNILAVHDIGQYDGAPFLVTEILDGESLRDVLRRGVPSHRKAIDYAIQIAHGLAAAHGKDIAHRDLKPDNIFITREGRVKILDFGLAKVIEKAAASHDGGTMTSVVPATEVGTVVGTAGYMSPEQVRGTAVDCRTDIFSFGTVVYEMLSGNRAFKHDTTAETMTAILREEPPELMESGRQIPPGLDRIVRHCLEKAPEQRFQSARDLAFDLESLSTLTPSGSVSAAKTKERKHYRQVAAIAALVAVAALAGWKLSSALHPAISSQFHQLTFRRGTPDSARFTPDGLNVVYAAQWEGAEPELYTVAANGMDGHPLGIKNARLLAISSHGELAVALNPQRISSLLAPGNLGRTSEGSGAPKPEIENVQDADFSPDGSALAIVRFLQDQSLCQLEYPIGKALLRAPLISDLRFSRDGKYLAFIRHDNPTDDRGVVTIVRSSGEKVAASPLYESAAGLAWSASGEEVWTTSPLASGTIHALSLSGKTRIPLSVPGRLRLQDISAKGELLAEQGMTRRGMAVSINNGEIKRDLSWLHFSYVRAISDDGKMVLFEEEGSESVAYKVFVRDVDGSPAVPIGEGYGLALSRDKQWAMAQKLVQPEDEIWLLPIGPGQPRRISPPGFVPFVGASFLPDGKRVIYVAAEGGRPPRAWLLELDGGKPRAITPEGFGGAAVSPDGKWLVSYRLLVPTAEGVTLVSLVDGTSKPIANVKPSDFLLGWADDDQIYLTSPPDLQRATLKIEKLNPQTGVRSAWKELSYSPIGGIFPEAPIFTPDGKSFAYDYRLRLWDLYTVSGVR